MAYVNPMLARYYAAVGQEAQPAAAPSRPRFVSYSPTPQPVSAPKSDRQATLEDIIGKAAVTSQAQKADSGGGFWGTVLNNPIGRGVGNVLKVTSVPARALTLTLEEALNLNDDPGEGSLEANRRKIMDPNYGVKQALNIEFGDSKLANLAEGLTGFAGDVAIDPMTYFTMGAGKFAGQAGRIAAATKLADAGMDAAKVARYGVNVATPAERAVIFAGMDGAEQLAKPGLRFMGARVPGTERLAMGVGGGLSRTRAMIGDMVPDAIRNVRRPEGLEDAYRVLASGRGNTRDALAQVARSRTHAATAGMFGAQFANEADRLAHNIGKEGRGQEIFRALDEGMPINDQLAADVEKLFDDIHAEGVARVPTMGHRQDFAPHIYTREGRDAMRGDAWQPVRQQIGMDVTTATGGTLRRSIHPGMKLKLPDGRVVEFVADTAHGAVSARQINEKLGGALGGVKLIEDDISRVLQPYIEGIADSVGRAEGLRRLSTLADTADRVAVVDKKATKAKGARQAVEIGDEIAGRSAAQSALGGDLTLGARQVKDDLVAELEYRLGQAKAQGAPAPKIAELQSQLDQVAAGGKAELFDSGARVPQEVLNVERAFADADPGVFASGYVPPPTRDELLAAYQADPSLFAAGRPLPTRGEIAAAAGRVQAAPAVAMPAAAAAAPRGASLADRVAASGAKVADLRAQLDQIVNESMPAIAERRAQVAASRDAELAGLQPELDALNAAEEPILLREADLRAQADEVQKGRWVDGERPAGTKSERKAAADEARWAAEDEARAAREPYEAQRRAVIERMQDVERRALEEFDQLDAAQRFAERRKARAEAKLDVEQVNYEQLKSDLDETRKLLERVRKLKTDPKGASAAEYERIGQELQAVAAEVGNFSGAADTADLLEWYARGVSRLKDGQQLNKALVGMQKAARAGKIQPVVKMMIRDGYEQIGVSLLGEADAPIVRAELARQLTNVEKAIDDSRFWRVIDKYTQFFKTYATATVGFHVRNGMSAAFMNATDGVAVRSMERGIQLWELYAKNPRGFLDNLPGWITREQADAALKAVFGSGGGAGQFGKAELRLGNNKVMNNPYTRLSQKAGGRVEGYARMGMAVDSVLRGEGWEEAAARITRIHFNYAEVSKFDRMAKRFIPFWTFMSRNVPLQLTQMFLKPRMYHAYASLQRNMGQDYEGSMVPLSWQEAGAFQLTDGVWLAPDLPHVRLQQELGKLTTDPQRLMSDLNPLLKIPFETMVAKRKLFTDTPFADNSFEAVGGSGLEVLAPVLSALGLTETAGDGTKVVDEKLAYALRGLVPPLGQIQRLAGGNDYYDDKQAQSVANWMGIPLRFLTPGQQEAERKRRERVAARAAKGDAREAALAAWSQG